MEYYQFQLENPFIEGESLMAGNNVGKNELNNKTNAFEFSLGFRRNLGYLIPWL